MLHKLALPAALLTAVGIAAAAGTYYGSIVPATTDVTVKLSQAIDSKSASAGDTFLATIASAVESVAGTTAVPAGTPAKVELISTAGTDGPSFALTLKEITVGGVAYPVTTGLGMLANAAETGVTSKPVTVLGGGNVVLQVVQGSSLTVPSGASLTFTLGALLNLNASSALPVSK